MRTCTVPGCGRSVRSRNLCAQHYLKALRAGALPKTLPRTCSVEGCGRKHRGLGYCAAHLSRAHRGGDVGAPIHERWHSCKVPGCANPHAARGYCVGHYGRFRRGKDVSGALTVKQRKAPNARHLDVDVAPETYRAMQGRLMAEPGLTLSALVRRALARELDAGGANHG